ncbi:MAG: type II toxin-antitoxin system HipA family toxin [Proteobacteria bacterium]|nr:type II toxin-antitoxin system HipA family toxin [Pseudomonadota bacterium]
MKLNVFVSGRHVATLESEDGFDHNLTYLSGASTQDFVSLAMPVQTSSWTWPALHPFFQVSLPEGFLLSVLKEQLGPHLGASPLDLLSVVGHNLIGRVQVSAAAQPNPLPALEDLGPLLHGEASPQVFLDLMTRYAASGVSGVVPKFLTPETQALFRKGTVPTERHIVKASSERQPFVALNEHLCMQAAAATGIDVARTMVSDDGQVLVVERFDINPETLQRKGFEDFCSLLGLTPDDKYESTWERAARLTRDYVPKERLREANEHLAVTLLLTYALGNADCHTKNLAFVYDSFEDVRVAPVYDMLTILAYDAYANNPPGMYVDGRKDWNGHKALWRFMQQHLGIEPARQRELVDRVCGAVAQAVPELLQRIRHTVGFEPVGLRMLWEWNEGMNRLRERRTFSLPNWVDEAQAQGLPRPAPAPRFAARRIGESPLLAPRRRTRSIVPSP